MLDRLKFDGAPVLVTGGGQGIGQSTCEVLAELGAHVILVSKTEENVRTTEELLKKAGAACEGHVADVSVKAEVDALAAASASTSALTDTSATCPSQAAPAFFSSSSVVRTFSSVLLTKITWAPSSASTSQVD